jgi:hypothetical protein
MKIEEIENADSIRARSLPGAAAIEVVSMVASLSETPRSFRPTSWPPLTRP